MNPRLQFIWHFHQPYYGVIGRPEELFFLPWVRLHAIKSYYDMARMLERHPSVRATINFSGSLLHQIRAYVDDGARDTWWHLSLKPAHLLNDHDKRHILRHFFSIDHERCVKIYPGYAALLAGRGAGDEIERFSVDDFRDLQVWFNLAWFGFSAREDRPLLGELIKKGRGFTEVEKEAVLEQQLDVMQLVVPLYRDLHRRGQIEVSMTPMYHPILPLLIDTDSAKRATPNRPTPRRMMAPEDAVQQVEDALNIAREFLSIDCVGMWPSEGSVSPEVVSMFRSLDVEWIATDEDVLKGSLGADYAHDDLFQGWRVRSEIESEQAPAPTIFFRDHELSDKIGFVYKDNPPAASATDFVDRVLKRSGVVTVALDGENPWEHFPGDGEAFLEALYNEIESRELETVVPSEYDGEIGVLESIHSGSWIMGNYQIWIGHSETNSAWNMLGDARRALIDALDEKRIGREAATVAFEALYAAQGSDWFWWFGDDFSSENDLDFDRLFRENLSTIYHEIGTPVPDSLTRPITSSVPRQQVFSPPTDLIDPAIDGKADYFYEWAGAGVYRNTGSHGSMFELFRCVDEINVGFDLENVFVKIELTDDGKIRADDLRFVMTFSSVNGVSRVRLSTRAGGSGEVERDGSSKPLLDVAFDTAVELAIPNHRLGVSGGDIVSVSCVVMEGDVQIERHPATQFFEFEVPDASFEARNWMV